MAPTLLLPHYVPPERSDALREAIADGVADVTVHSAATPEESLDLAPEADALITYRLDEELREAAPALEWVQALSAGVDSYDHDALAEQGVVLTNASGVHAEPIAEQVVGYMLAFERGFLEAEANKRRNAWERFSGGELRNKTVGILGVGAIGTRVAELVAAFDVAVLGSKRDLESIPEVVDEAVPAGEHRELCRRSDYLVLACPLTDATRCLIGRDEFRLMSDEAVLINVARGEVVDEEALIRALQYRSIRGAALDVFETEPLPADSPLWDLSNVLLTPHMAGSTPYKVDRLADLVVENVRRYVAGESLQNRIV